jgi:NTF2 fold immunity protein
MKFCFTICVLLLGSIHALGQYKPPNGFVPDEATAIKIAVAIWTPIFGNAKIAKEKPYHATLKGDVWTVEGSLPEGYNGGVAHVEISKEDGRILLLYHGK